MRGILSNVRQVLTLSPRCQGATGRDPSRSPPGGTRLQNPVQSLFSVVALGAGLALSACARAPAPSEGAGAMPVVIQVFRHGTGDAEMAASAASVDRFNASQKRWRVAVEVLPQGRIDVTVGTLSSGITSTAAQTGHETCRPPSRRDTRRSLLQPLHRTRSLLCSPILLPSGTGTRKSKTAMQGENQRGRSSFPSASRVPS